ncbi:unnamed protein product [Sphagnum compactum]
MSRVYVGNLDRRGTERELEDEFHVYGVRQRWPSFARSVGETKAPGEDCNACITSAMEQQPAPNLDVYRPNGGSQMQTTGMYGEMQIASDLKQPQSSQMWQNT